MKTTLKEHNLFMGYTNSYKAEDDPTSFFCYEDGEIDEDVKQKDTDRY